MREPNLLYRHDDRALNYGDGCFSTIAFSAGAPQLLLLHVTRLAHDAAALGIALETVSIFVPQLAQEQINIPDEDWQTPLQNAIQALIDASSQSRGIIKVLLSRGHGGRGYAPENCTSPVFVVTEHGFPNRYDDWHQRGLSLGVSTVRLGRQPLLAGIKHLNRLEQVLIKQQLALLEGIDDVVVLDEQGYVIEASAGNLFWRNQAGEWCTPILSHCGVKGVMRQRFLNYLHVNNLALDEREFFLTDILKADAVLVCNAVMGIVAVHTIHTNQGAKVQYNIQPVVAINAELVATGLH